MKQQNTNTIITATELKLLLVGLFMISFTFVNKKEDVKLISNKRIESKNLKSNQRSIASVSNSDDFKINFNTDEQNTLNKINKEYLAFVAQRKFQEANMDSRTNRFLETTNNPYDSGKNADDNLKDYEVIEKHNAFLNEVKEEENTEELEWDVAASSLENEEEY